MSEHDKLDINRRPLSFREILAGSVDDKSALAQREAAIKGVMNQVTPDVPALAQAAQFTLRQIIEESAAAHLHMFSAAVKSAIDLVRSGALGEMRHEHQLLVRDSHGILALAHQEIRHILPGQEVNITLKTKPQEFNASATQLLAAAASFENADHVLGVHNNFVEASVKGPGIATASVTTVSASASGGGSSLTFTIKG